MLTFIVPWVFAAIFPLSLYLWGWRSALLHAGQIIVWSMIFADLLLVRFRKFPFTCTYPPFRHSAIVVMLLYFFGFSTFVALTSRLDYWILRIPALILLFIPITFGTWYVRSRWRQDMIDIDKQLIFEEKQPADFEVLNLGQWS
jgi:hypothetical protein